MIMMPTEVLLAQTISGCARLPVPVSTGMSVGPGAMTYAALPLQCNTEQAECHQ